MPGPAVAGTMNHLANRNTHHEVHKEVEQGDNTPTQMLDVTVDEYLIRHLTIHVKEAHREGTK